MKSLIKRYFFCIKSNRDSYLFLSLLSSLPILYFFIAEKFFEGNGTVGLHRYFSLIPLLYIFILPFLSSFMKIKQEENLPFSEMTLILAKNIVLSSCVLASVLISLIVPVYVSRFIKVDFFHVSASLTGIIFYTAASVSLTIYIHSKIKNSGTAFIATAVILASTNLAHRILFYTDPGDIISFILKYVSFSCHYESFSKGIIDFGELIFFAGTTFLFMILSCRSKEKERGIESDFLKKITHSAFISFILIQLIFSRFNSKIDLTSSRQFTLSTFTKEITEELKEPLNITYYVSPKLRNTLPQTKDISDILESFADSNEKINFSQIILNNKNLNKVKEKLESMQIYPMTIRESEENNNFMEVYSAITLEYLGETKAETFIISPWDLEYKIANIIYDFVYETPRTVQILNTEKDNASYGFAKAYLKTNGFSVIETESPSRIFWGTPLILFGSSSFTKSDINFLEKAILNGTKTFAACKPFNVDLKNGWKINETDSTKLFERMLFTFGIYFKDSITASNKNIQVLMQTEDSSKREKIDYCLWPVLNSQKEIPLGFQSFWPCAVDTDDEVADLEKLKVQQFLKTSTDSFQYEKIDGTYITNPFICSKIETEKIEKNSFYLGAEVTKKGSKNPILILVGDQYAFSDQMMQYSSTESSYDIRSLDLLVESMFRLFEQDDFIKLKNKNIQTSRLKISAAEFKASAVSSILFCSLFPFAVFSILYAHSILRRKKFNA